MKKILSMILIFTLCFSFLVSINTVYADEEFNTQSEALKVARKLYESFDQELLEQSIYPDDFAIVSIDNPYFVSSNVIRYKKTNFDVSKQEIISTSWTVLFKIW